MTNRARLRPPGRARRWWVAGAGLLLAACTPPGLPPPQAPTVTLSGSSRPGSDTTLFVGVDGPPQGFNPHLIADNSVGAAAIAALVLPSAFDETATGPVLDTSLLDSATVTATDPFTVTYRIARAAAWSDGTPITADDFSYLTGQMQTQNGTIDPAGYRMVTAVQSRDAGKTAVVTFRAPFADWRHLYGSLLPSHTLKDAPGGWTDALDFILPVSGNRYKFTDLDSTTDEATLLRNDKYWGTQPGPASVVLRFGEDAALLDAFRRGDLQALMLRPDSATRDALDAAVPAAQRVTVPRPSTVQLLFGLTTGPTAQPAVRRAVAAALDLRSLRTALGGTAGALIPTATDFTLPDLRPSATAAATAAGAPPTAGSLTPGSAGQSAMPTADSAAAAAARALLQSAGYQAGGVYVERNGQPLRLSLAYPSGNARFGAAAALIQGDLGRAGIEVDLVAEPQSTVVADRFTAAGSADLTLLAVPRGASDTVAASSALGCAVPAPSGSAASASRSPAVTGTTAAAATSGTGPTGVTGATSPTTTSAAPGPTVNEAGGNVSRYCDQALQPVLTEGLTSGRVATPVLDALSAQLPLIDLGQPTVTFVVSAPLVSVVRTASADWVWATPLIGLPTWPSS